MYRNSEYSITINWCNKILCHLVSEHWTSVCSRWKWHIKPWLENSRDRRSMKKGQDTNELLQWTHAQQA